LYLLDFVEVGSGGVGEGGDLPVGVLDVAHTLKQKQERAEGTMRI
jgi:hypothetical protein